MDSKSVEEAIERWHEFEEAVQQIHGALVEAFEKVWERIYVFCEAFHAVLWRSYLANGAPYGKNNEGMWRWAHECVEIARLRAEADRIEEHHRTLIEFRKIVREKRRMG
jgi:hypothetical protein